jgi:hypothetical protein
LALVVAHGDPGEAPRDNVVQLWGGHALSVADLGAMLDAAPQARPLRLVVTSCFSGGFAELVFANTRAERGMTSGDRCGLFASTWDREASGCDPNPDRRAQESYGLHFLHALRGENKSGAKLPAHEIDLDGDGKVSLSEAHARVRVATMSLSVPTSTSERWLRHAAPARGPRQSFELPEEERVVAVLGARLGLDSAESARERHAALEERASALEARLEAADEAAEPAYRALRMALLERWPVLDDPYHPDHAATVAGHASDILALLDDSPEATGYVRARDGIAGMEHELDELDVEQAAVERLVRAHETIELAGRLRAAGGAAFEGYRKLLACERWVP